MGWIVVTICVNCMTKSGVFIIEASCSCHIFVMQTLYIYAPPGPADATFRSAW